MILYGIFGHFITIRLMSLYKNDSQNFPRLSTQMNIQNTYSTVLHQFPFMSFPGKARIVVSFYVWPSTEDSQVASTLSEALLRTASLVSLQACEIILVPLKSFFHQFLVKIFPKLRRRSSKRFQRIPAMVEFPRYFIMWLPSLSIDSHPP